MMGALWLLGAQRLRVGVSERTDALNICLENGFSYSDFSWEADGGVSFLMPPVSARRFRRTCRAGGITVAVVGGKGLPMLLWAMRRRAGLWLGALVAVVLILLSCRFVWAVEVTGNVNMSDEAVRGLLRECDFGVGSYIPDINARALENRVLLQTDELAWIALYMDGTVARVQVIERENPTDPVAPSVDASKPANLVAAADGQIERVQLYRGEIAVTVGQAVKKGELLVSGVYDSTNAGFRYTRAAGEVYARVEHTYTVEIPLSYREKHYTDQKTQSLALNFFNFPVKIFKSTGKKDDNCDIIEDKIDWTGSGAHALPFFFTRTYACAYEWATRTRTPSEATLLAHGELEKSLSELSARAELLSRRVETEITDTAVILHCTVTCIENIAVQSEFEIRETD